MKSYYEQIKCNNHLILTSIYKTLYQLYSEIKPDNELKGAGLFKYL